MIGWPPSYAGGFQESMRESPFTRSNLIGPRGASGLPGHTRLVVVRLLVMKV